MGKDQVRLRFVAEPNGSRASTVTIDEPGEGLTSLETETPQSRSFYLDPYEDVVPKERVGGYLAAVRRYWWAVLLAFVVAVAGALALSASSAKTYDATAKVLLAPAEPVDILQQTTGGTHSLDPTADLNTAVQLVSLDKVARKVRNQLHVQLTPQELLSHLTVAPVGNSNIIGITAQDASPAVAAAIANAFAQEYVNVRRTNASALYNQAANAGRAELASVPRRDRSAAQWKTLAARTDQLRVDAALQTGGAQLVDAATNSATPASPSTKTNVMEGAVLGLFVGFLAAIGLDRYRPRRPERLAKEPERTPTRAAAS